jgi:hypothetical protein
VPAIPVTLLALNHRRACAPRCALAELASRTRQILFAQTLTGARGARCFRVLGEELPVRHRAGSGFAVTRARAASLTLLVRRTLRVLSRVARDARASGCRPLCAVPVPPRA